MKQYRYVWSAELRVNLRQNINQNCVAVLGFNYTKSLFKVHSDSGCLFKIKVKTG